jgi:hypothetical protein
MNEPLANKARNRNPVKPRTLFAKTAASKPEEENTENKSESA